jgi:hypothetical protein
VMAYMSLAGLIQGTSEHSIQDRVLAVNVLRSTCT